MATPIGNLGDITHRAIETLRSVDLIACEDTRHTGNLLRHLGFQKPLLRYDEHVHEKATDSIAQLLAQGKSIALVTDAGTPAISDPGRRLVRALKALNHKVIPIPGASSVIAAISAAGLAQDGFIFLGFLPRKKGPAQRLLRECLGLGKTVAVFESPFRVVETLEWVEELPGHLNVVVARELTKIHEELIDGTAAKVRQELSQRKKLGECLILLSPEPLKKDENGNENEQP